LPGVLAFAHINKIDDHRKGGKPHRRYQTITTPILDNLDTYDEAPPQNSGIMS